MGSSIRNALLGVLLALGAAGTLDAQGLRVTGRIVRGVAPDSVVPLNGVWATLHAVTNVGGSPVDSQRTRRDGRYRFRVDRPDTAAIYLVSTSHQGITYFSEAIVPQHDVDSVDLLVVYDTSSVGPPIRVVQRHLVVRMPDGDNGRRTLELLTLGNRGAATRVSPDGVRPTWRGRLPAGLVQFQVGESDVSAAAVSQHGDTVDVTAPLPPGDKQLLYTYVLPASERELVLPIEEATDRLIVLLEDTAAVPIDGNLTFRGIEVFEDAQFALFEGANIAPGTRVAFRFSRGRLLGSEQLWVVFVAIAGTGMLAAIVLWWRRQEPAPSPVVPEVLAREIAALDKAFEAHGAASAEAEAAYREERARLKQQLAEALARRGDLA